MASLARIAEVCRHLGDVERARYADEELQVLARRVEEMLEADDR